MKIKDVILEKAPPEAKFKRMAKHIKAGYKGSGLDKDEIAQRAFGATWKAHNKEKGVAEQQSGSNYTSNEIVAILSGQKTQAQVDAERKAKAAQAGTQPTGPRTPGKSQTPAREATGDKMGQVTSVTPAGDVKIKTPSGTEITTKKDALLPGAQPGTVQMKPDATDDALKPGTQVVSSEDMNDDAVRPEHEQSVGEGRMSKVDIDLRDIANSGDQDDLLDALSGSKGNAVADVLEDMMSDIANKLGIESWMGADPDTTDKMIEILWDRLVDEYGGNEDYDEGDFDAPEADFDFDKVVAVPKEGNVPSMEDQAADNVTSPISGAEDHDEITKLMVQRIRKLAGL